jgi:chaperonin GroES
MSKLAKPMGDRVLVKLKKFDQKTASGIIIPDSVNIDDVRTAEVVAVGDGLFSTSGQLVPTTVKVGDEVIFGPHIGIEIKLSGEDYILIREGDIYLICR